MLSITQLKKNIYALFKIMRNTGNTFEIVYKGVVYDMDVRKTTKKPKLTRARKDRHSIATVQTLNVTTCPNCGEVMVDNICMARCQAGSTKAL